MICKLPLSIYRERLRPKKQMADQEKKTVFTRQSTGLVKNVSFLDAITLNLGNMSIGAGLGTIGLTTSALALYAPSVVSSGFNLVLTSIIAFVLSIPQIIVYTMMTRRFPRTGGDYVWTSRTFGGFVGSSFSFMGYTLETLAYLALIALSAVFAVGGVLVSLGDSNATGLSVPGNVLSSVGITGTAATNALIEQFAIGAIIFAILIAINIFTPKTGYKLVSALIVIGAICLVVAILTLFASGSSGVSNYISFANSKFFANTNATAVGSGTPSSANPFNWNGVFFMIPFFAIFVYPWLNAAPAVGSEIKGKSAVRWNVPISAVISLILITSAFGAMYYVGGFKFTSGALTGNLAAYADFNFWTMAMGATTSYALQVVIGLGWIVWNIGVLAYGVIVFSRYLFAQAFDRFLPEKLSYVSPRFSSPIIAHIIDLVITVALIGVATVVYGTLSLLFGNVIAAMIYFLVVGLGAATYAIKREKGSAKWILAIAGVAMAIVFAFITSQFLETPSIWGTSTIVDGIKGYYLAYIYVVVSFIAGAIIFLVSRSVHKSKGIDITLAYKEIPPE
jgi:amino acid transporter